MSKQTIAGEANQQLDRVLGFFPRVDGKASAFLAMNTGVLAVGLLNLRAPDLANWYLAAPAAIGLGLTIASIYFCYRCMFPELEGGQGSLVYFREIAGQTETIYVSRATARTEDEHIADLLGQVWRNSQILKSKFDAVKRSFSLLMCSLGAWSLFILLSSVIHAQMPLING